jgi:hypothetical protein
MILRVIGSCLMVAAFFGMFTFSGCDEPEDPCKGKNAVSADFKIYEVQQLALPEDYDPLDADTVSTDFVLFEAIEEDATYEWTLGAETITTKSFVRSDFPRGQNFEVSLKVTKTPDKSCFPNDDGEDFKTRKFYTTVNYGCDTRVEGTFEGFNKDEPTKKRTIIIDPCFPNPFLQNDYVLRINNLVEECDAIDFNLVIAGYRHIYFGGNGQVGCLNPMGEAKLSITNLDSIKIDYKVRKTQSDPNTLIDKTFIGIRK